MFLYTVHTAVSCIQFEFCTLVIFLQESILHILPCHITQPYWLPRSLISPVFLIIAVWMWPEWHSGCLWIRLERGGGLIFTIGLGKPGQQSLGEKMVLITDLSLLFLSVSLFLLLSFCLFRFLSVFPYPSEKAGAFLCLFCLFWV